MSENTETPTSGNSVSPNGSNMDNTIQETHENTNNGPPAKKRELEGDIEPPAQQPLPTPNPSSKEVTQDQPLDSGSTNSSQNTDLNDRQIREAQRQEERAKVRAAKEAERAAEKARKEAERLAEKARKETEKQAEKERKEAEKAAEKKRKDEEKAAKETERLAEKARKEAERKAEKERKEAERKAEKERKEAEKLAQKQAQKQAEIEKKRQMQPQINSFFKKNQVSSPAKPETKEIEDTDASTDYRQKILPFCARTNGKLFSSVVNYESKPDENSMSPKDWLKSLQKPAAPSRISSQEFQTKLALVSESNQIIDLLKLLHIKRLQFSHLSARHLENPDFPLNEEFRPPYIGSTRSLPSETLVQLSKEPLSTIIDDKQVYDYDSEAEWEQEDGEDLRDEDEHDSEEELDSEDLGEFLSNDEDDSSGSRLKFVGPLTPIVVDHNMPDLLNFKVQILAPQPLNLKNPFNDPEPAPLEAAPAPKNTNEILLAFAEKVGREPLKTALKQVENSTATKTLHIELLKQQFTSVKEKEIRQIFDLCLERQGKKKTEKKWVLMENIKPILDI